MIITRLTLNNFGVYAGVNTFEFSEASDEDEPADGEQK